MCLFCRSIEKAPYYVFTHMASQHNFDMFSAACQWDLDQVSYIKFINYVRKHKPKPEELLAYEASLWDSDDYMKPFSPGDTLLTFGKYLLKAIIHIKNYIFCKVLVNIYN